MLLFDNLYGEGVNKRFSHMFQLIFGKHILEEKKTSLKTKRFICFQKCFFQKYIEKCVKSVFSPCQYKLSNKSILGTHVFRVHCNKKHEKHENNQICALSRNAVIWKRCALQFRQGTSMFSSGRIFLTELWPFYVFFVIL